MGRTCSRRAKSRDERGGCPARRRRALAGSEAFDDTLLRAVDELYSARVISDATWGKLAARLNDQQLLDVLITTGGYHMVSMALNTFGVQLEPGGERIRSVVPSRLRPEVVRSWLPRPSTLLRTP